MKIRTFGWAAVAALAVACDSPLDVDPTASIDAGTALTTPRGIELGLNGAYRSLQSGSLLGLNELVYPDLYSDNLDFTGTFQTDREVALRSISTSNGAILGIWGDAYEGINRANSLLEALPNVAALSAELQTQYRGEALFIRALHYTILNRYFGGVPILTEPSSGVGAESLVSRNTAAEVWTLVEDDLAEAATLLEPGPARGRASRDAANALLARIYLESGKHAEARDRATTVIATGNYELIPTYRDLFETKNSSETIFELQHSLNNSNSLAFWYFTQSLGGRWGFAPSQSLFDAYEAGDPRRAASIGVDDGDRYGNKYFRIANGDDNVIVLRLAEMYLIRAEANARLGAAPAVVRADIDIVRNRAGLSNLPASVTSQAALFDAILQERRVEFAMEGHRFYDLRRLGRAEEVLAIAPNRLLWPIPQAERDVNENLTQNPGY